jgi:adenine-specific DNA methylase
MNYPKRLIEVDLPIKRISAHARREKSIRHGHISTLHIWWARRPLAACRAVICASLWPDPADPNCPQPFRDVALKQMIAFAKATQSNHELSTICDNDAWQRYMKLASGLDIDATTLKGQIAIRAYLLDFIADFAAWEASTNHWFLDTARSLTQAAHEALGGEKGTRPLVVDPFAGGGAIPLEALRVGADAFASDLNPVAVLLNKVVLEYIPKYGDKLADEVRKWGKWIKEQAEKELAQFYPKDADGSTPIAYLWARTIKCEGPGCGAEVPLMRSLWLAKKGNRSVAMRINPNAKHKRVDFEIIKEAKAKDVGEGTVRRGSATCPCCGYTTPVASVRVQMKARKGGSDDARMFAVVTTRATDQGRFFRLPTVDDLKAVQAAAAELEKRKAAWCGELSLVPDELTPRGGGSGAGRAFSQRHYGMEQFCDLFTSRQLLSLTTLGRWVRETGKTLAKDHALGMAEAVQSVLACAVDRGAEHLSSLCRWNSSGPKMQASFGRQAISMMWDFCEADPFGGSVGSWESLMECVLIPFETCVHLDHVGNVERASAAVHPLPNDSVSAFITDPPYYDAIPYSDLSDFFYVWLRRNLPTQARQPFLESLAPKTDECIVDEVKGKDRAYFEKTMGQAMAEGRRVLHPSGVGIVVFAHKSTAGWEAQLQAMVDAGWIMTGSWPIDTEMGSRLRAQDSAALASSVHLVCRPREDADGNVRENEVGDWRDVLAELPKRTRQWMKRLGEEGVVGADAIFACLGPALEIFSRYSRVEKASGEQVMLKEYLTYIWGAVAQEALTQIFKEVDASGFEEDARLTAMWLWTLNAGAVTNGETTEAMDADAEETPEEDEERASPSNSKASGYLLEFDAARKIAQGLGAHLEDLDTVVEIKGDKARLLSVPERTRRLFGKDEADAPQPKRKKKDKQLKLFSLEEVESQEGGWGDKSVPKLGDTTLDRVHQSMILFAAGRGEALRRFLVEDGAGQDQRFWKLANALSALYPQGTDEKRWVDGVLARKKGLGL